MLARTIIGGLAALAATSLLTPTAWAAPREMTINQETLGSVTLLAPQAEPKAFVVYMVDGAPTPESRAQAEQIVARGAAVVQLSAQDVIRQLEAHAEKDDDCFYLLGEFEDLSTTAQRALGAITYRWPVILGNGALSGTLAYLSIAQAPSNTAAGAVSIGFGNQVKSKLPFCPGAKGTVSPSGGFTYEPATDIPGSWTLVEPAEPAADIQAFIKADSGNELRVVSGNPQSQFDAGLQAALDVGSPPSSDLADLPIIELPAQGRNSAFAIFLSGDGGWRDIDKSIAETLSQNGMSVVGIDSLRYFWKAKDPAQIAKDIERIISHYQQRWQAQRVILLGFSMGADVIPPTWRKLSAATQDKIKLIALLGLEPTALYEISVTGYLGVSSDEVDIRPDLKALPGEKVMCFYGMEEKQDGDTACTLPELSGATLMERSGGHHLDGNYEAVAKDILERIKTMK